MGLGESGSRMEGPEWREEPQGLQELVELESQESGWEGLEGWE